MYKKKNHLMPPTIDSRLTQNLQIGPSKLIKFLPKFSTWHSLTVSKIEITYKPLCCSFKILPKLPNHNSQAQFPSMSEKKCVLSRWLVVITEVQRLVDNIIYFSTFLAN